MKFKPGDMLSCPTTGLIRFVVATQPYVGIPTSKEHEVLLMYPDNSTRWYSSTWLSAILKKVGDDTEELG